MYRKRLEIRFINHILFIIFFIAPLTIHSGRTDNTNNYDVTSMLLMEI